MFELSERASEASRAQLRRTFCLIGAESFLLLLGAPGGPIMDVLHFAESESMEHLAGGGSAMLVPANRGSVSGHECSIWTEAHKVVVAREGDSA